MQGSGQEQNQENLRSAYGELCKSYHVIDTFRAELLKFLPFVSGSGILLIFKYIKPANQGKLFLLGIIGIVITLGLFFFELRGIHRCTRLINTGKKLEKLMNVKGQFVCYPDTIGNIINEPGAAGIIYSSVLSGWAYVAMTPSKYTGYVALIVFFVGFFGTYVFYQHVVKKENE